MKFIIFAVVLCFAIVQSLPIDSETQSDDVSVPLASKPAMDTPKLPYDNKKPELIGDSKPEEKKPELPAPKPIAFKRSIMDDVKLAGVGTPGAADAHNKPKTPSSPTVKPEAKP